MSDAKRKQRLLAQSARARAMGVKPLQQAVARIDRLAVGYMLDCAPDNVTPAEFDQFANQISQLQDLQKQMRQIVDALPIPSEAQPC
tara:strand:+ start:364 stop:624 length:261 start_codon:yes stop_codon:yes gene_type:complete